MCADSIYSETSLIRHSMGPDNNVGIGGCWIMECLLPHNIMVGLERMLDYRGVRLESFYCNILKCIVIIYIYIYIYI